ncbi:MAG TPA: hypothetical protein VFB49_02460 [Patescibacteria group bacterium]|nr:hypothetical protein [Patescibacteria group bacterium]
MPGAVPGPPSPRRLATAAVVVWAALAAGPAPLPACAAVRAAAGERAPGDAATANVAADFDAMARRLTESMSKDLGLSAIQIPEVERTNLAAARSMRDAALQWQAGDKASTQTLVQQAVKAFTTRENDLRAILTPDQQELFQQQRTVRGAEMQTRLMGLTLKLDEAQTAKVSRLNLDSARKMQGALAPARNPSATPAQKFQAMRAAESVQKEKDDGLHEVLDKDQWKAYAKQKEQMKEMLRESWQQRGGS